MLDRLIDTLVQSKNEAADDVLLEALRLGTEREQRRVLSALLRRATVRGLCGVISQYDRLPEPLQLHVLRNIKVFHPALRACGRSDDLPMRLAALKLVALGRQGRLAYVLSENLHNSDDTISKAATEAIVALARWASTAARALQKGEVNNLWLAAGGAEGDAAGGATASETSPAMTEAESTYRDLVEQRPEIEAAVARALDVHRGRHGQDLLRAGLLLCDWPGSKTLAILKTTKHGGQSPMVRRLQQPPASEHVEAFLLGASHGQLRSHFGVAFSHVVEAPVLDGLLRKTHWLKDHQLQLCVHQVSRGVWWEEAELVRDVERRTPDEAAKIGEWIAVSGVHDVMQDERLSKLRAYATHNNSFEARLHVLRIAARRKRNASVGLIQAFLSDSDERLVRIAAREIVRRRPPEYETILLQRMTTAPPSVRRIIARAIGQAGFEHYWQRFDRLQKPVRKQAGKAMLKLLPDGLQRLQRRLTDGPVEQRVKAMQMAQELGVAEALRETLVQLCNDPNPKLRSKAVSVLGGVASVPPDVLVERLVNDADPRVRANTIEALEAKGDKRFLPVLAQRAMGAATGRERANAVKALHSMKVSTASGQLLLMLRDDRPEHRISALWALRQIGWWQLLGEVGRLAKADNNLKVRRYALAVLRGVAELAKAQPGQPPTDQGPQKQAG
jgi:HEAT repeat protein